MGLSDRKKRKNAEKRQYSKKASYESLINKGFL